MKGNKWDRFADLYFECHYNATEAYAKLKGLTKEQADTNAWRFLKHPKTKKAIADKVARELPEHFTNKDGITKEAIKLYESCVKDGNQAIADKVLNTIMKAQGIVKDGTSVNVTQTQSSQPLTDEEKKEMADKIRRFTV